MRVSLKRQVDLTSSTSAACVTNMYRHAIHANRDVGKLWYALMAATLEAVRFPQVRLYYEIIATEVAAMPSSHGQSSAVVTVGMSISMH